MLQRSAPPAGTVAAHIDPAPMSAARASFCEMLPQPTAEPASQRSLNVHVPTAPVAPGPPPDPPPGAARFAPLHIARLANPQSQGQHQTAYLQPNVRRRALHCSERAMETPSLTPSNDKANPADLPRPAECRFAPEMPSRKACSAS